MVLLLLSFPYEEDTLIIIYFLFFFLWRPQIQQKKKLKKKTVFKKLSRWKVEHITDSRGKYEGRKIR